MAAWSAFLAQLFNEQKASREPQSRIHNRRSGISSRAPVARRGGLGGNYEIAMVFLCEDALS